MTALTIKAGDEISYSCAAGRLRATVRSISISPTAQAGLSIAWLNITTHATKQRPYPSQVMLPACPDSLKMYKVELI